MQNIASKIGKGFQDFGKRIKSKIVKKTSVPQYIMYQDFFRCEKSAKMLGFTFLKGDLTPPNKWLKFNGLAFYAAVVILLVAEIVSLVMSAQQKLWHISIENALFCGGYSIAAGKIFLIFYYHRAKIDEIIEVLDKHFPHFGVDQLTFKVQKYLDLIKWFETFYYVMFTFSVLHVTTFPFMHQIYGIYNSVPVEWETILAMILPFDQHHPVVYAVMWIAESWMIFFTTCIFTSSDLIFACLTHLLSMEFDILGQVMSEIDMFDGEEEAIKELKKLIAIHQELIEVSEKISEIFSGLLLLNSCGSIGILCFASFLPVSGIDGYFIAKYFSYPITVVIQIFTQCYFSQRHLDSSTSILTSAYNSEWYNGSKNYRKILIQIMIRLQKPQSITAWKFFDMSLEIFQWIVSTSYSYFSVLKALYEA